MTYNGPSRIGTNSDMKGNAYPEERKQHHRPTFSDDNIVVLSTYDVFFFTMIDSLGQLSL